MTNDSSTAAIVRTRMIAALGPHSPADEARLVVDMIAGCAVLHGCVHSWAQHEAIEQAVLATPGVTRVDNQLSLLVQAWPTDPRYANAAIRSR